MKQHKQRKILSLPVYLAIYIAVIVACVTIDQLAKHFIEDAVAAHGGRIRILGNWLTLVWTVNYGVTGGMLSGVDNAHWFIFAMTLLGLPVFFWLLWRSRTRSVWGQIAFSFVIGGTIGNALDRIIFAKGGFFTGGVRDFIQVQGFFGIFNTADSFLVVGVIMALLAIIFFDYDSLLNTMLEERRAKLAAQQASTPSDAAEVSGDAAQPVAPSAEGSADPSDEQQPQQSEHNDEEA